MSSSGLEATLDVERLEHARLDGPPVTLAYLAEEKSYVILPSLLFILLLIILLSVGACRGTLPLPDSRAYG
jgi:hypothetical protein